YDFLTAEREFERAIELNPRYTLAHQLFGWYLCTMDRYEEAYAEFQRAIRLDPLSSVIHAMLGNVLIYARRYDQALKQCAKALELDPTSGPAHLVAARIPSLIKNSKVHDCPLSGWFFNYFCHAPRHAGAYRWCNRQSLIVPSSLPEASQLPRESNATV